MHKAVLLHNLPLELLRVRFSQSKCNVMGSTVCLCELFCNVDVFVISLELRRHTVIVFGNCSSEWNIAVKC